MSVVLTVLLPESRNIDKRGYVYVFTATYYKYKFVCIRIILYAYKLN